MNPASPLILRPARPDDAPALAHLHVTVWRETYATLAPAQAMALLDEALRLRQWRAALADPDRACLLVERGGEVLGMVATAAPVEPAFGPRGEIRHLHVAATARRLGLGAQLLQAACDRVSQDGFAGAGLGVVAQNTAARAFYAAMGGREAGAYTDPGPLWRSEMVLVVWDAPLSAPRPR